MAEIVRAGSCRSTRARTRRRTALGHDPHADDAPDRAAAGDAGDHPADRERDDLDAQDHFAGQRDRARGELLYSRAARSTRVTFQMIPLLIVVSIWYMVLTSLLVGQSRSSGTTGGGARARTRTERHADRGCEAAVIADRSSGRGRAQELRRARGAAKASTSTVTPRRGGLHHRPVRFGQEHVPALHQPPRDDPGRPDLRRRRADRLPPGGGKLHELRENEIAAQRAEIGMVFQHFNLFPHMTALENMIEAPVARRGIAAPTRARAALELLARVGLGRQGRRLPGAAVRRPAAARRDRAGAGDAAEADAVRRADLRARPRAGRRGARRDARTRRDGMTMIVVTHEIGLRPRGRGRVVFMDEGRGRGGPAGGVVQRPAQERTQAFLSRLL